MGLPANQFNCAILEWRYWSVDLLNHPLKLIAFEVNITGRRDEQAYLADLRQVRFFCRSASPNQAPRRSSGKHTSLGGDSTTHILFYF